MRSAPVFNQTRRFTQRAIDISQNNEGNGKPNDGEHAAYGIHSAGSHEQVADDAEGDTPNNFQQARSFVFNGQVVGRKRSHCSRDGVCHCRERKKDCDDEEFMAMYEQYEVFDELEEQFMDMEELVTAQIAEYVDNNIEQFAEIVE